jgi:hypothetical protein
MLERVEVDRLVLVPGIQATPLMFVLLEMIMRSNQDSTTQLQGLHLMSLLTQPSICSALVTVEARGGAVTTDGTAEAAGTLPGEASASVAHSIAAEGSATKPTSPAAGGAALPWASLLPLLGAVVTTTKAVWVHNWGIQTLPHVLRESILVSAQVLRLVDAWSSQQQEVCSLQETSQSNISYGHSTQQAREALVWSAMFSIGRINSELASMEAVLTSRALSRGHWESLVTTAAAAAGPNGAAGDQVLAAFMQTPQKPRKLVDAVCSLSVSSASSAAELVKGSSSMTTGAAEDSVAVAEDMRMVKSTSVPPPPAKAYSLVCLGSTLAAQKLSAMAGSCPATTGAEQGSEVAVIDNHPLLGLTMAGVAVLEQFGIAGFKRLLTYVNLDYEGDRDLSSGSALTEFSCVLAVTVGVEVTETLSLALKSVCSSLPQDFKDICLDLECKWGTGSVAGTCRSVETFDKALASQSVAFCCNNPKCCNIQGWSELQLPQQGGRRGKGVCGGCRAACYCSKSCQEEAWPLHRLACSVHSGLVCEV